MFETEEHAGSVVWRVGGTPDLIECALPVLHETAAAVREGFLSIRRGGIEVGGVLFGTRDRSRVRILASRVVPCEHASGPSFYLSENDKIGLARLLQSYSDDPRLRGLVPVGWYHSHTRSQISLTEADRQIHERYFPEPWQIALVFRPDYFNPARVGVFVREPDGKLRTEPDHAEFEVGLSAEVLPERNVSEIGHPVPAAPVRVQAAETALLPTLSALSPPATRRSSPRKPLLAALAGAAVIALAVAAVIALPPLARRISQETTKRTQFAPPALSLRVQDQDGELLVLWDGAAKPVREAASAVLDITDGKLRTETPLDAGSLLRGSMTYSRYSSDVTVRMRLLTRGAEAVEETARFLGQPPPLQRAPEIAEARPALELPTANERPKPAPPEVQAPPQPKLAPPPPAQEGPTAANRPSPAPPKVQAPPQPKLPPPAPAPAKPKPAEVTLTQKIPGLFQQPAPAPSSAGKPSPGSVPATAPAAGPASGRLVWSGVLGRNDTLTITGGNASVGAVTGELPNFPIRVTAYPAELSAQGLIVFSSDSRHLSGNRTTYRWDPVRARGVVVVAPPSANTGWSRIVLRNTGRPLSAIVLHWERLPAQ